jgi:Na+/proline symporter
MISTSTIIGFIIAYFAFFIFLSYRLTGGYDQTKTGFLVANRNAGFWESSLAAGASWVLGMSLFASAGFGYNMGWAGLFWFLIPQTLSMFVFAWLSNSCNQRIPEGYTISGFIRDTYGRKVSTIYQFGLSLISLGFIVLTFTALNKLLTILEVDYIPLITGLVALGTVIYALKGGLKTNLITGSLQMVFMLAFCALLLAVAFATGGYDHLVAGINGKLNYTNLFDPKLLSTYAVAVALTSLAGVVGNQSYYQKSFSQQKTGTNARSFVLGGIFFAIVPLCLGTIGMMAYGAGIELKDATTAHLAWMQTNIGIAAIIAFAFVVLNCASNALDSQCNAFGAMLAHDFNKDEKRSVWKSRLGIVAIAIVGWALSTLNLDLAFIFLTYGAIRISLFIITIMAVRTTWLTSAGIFASVIVLAPITLYLNQSGMRMEAALLGFFVPPVAALAISYAQKKLTWLKIQ